MNHRNTSATTTTTTTTAAANGSSSSSSSDKYGTNGAITSTNADADLKDKDNTTIQQIPLIDKQLDNKSIAVVRYGSVSVFISILGAAVTFPFLQAQRDQLKCDTLCYGSMQSARSGLSLVGNIIVGRLSDKHGRVPMLWVGILASLSSYLINFYGNSLQAAWISLIPSALLNQNYSVLKALFADCNNESGGSESERASSMGKLGMAVGVAFMVGPMVGSTFLQSYSQAMIAAILFTSIAGLLLLLLPTSTKASGTSTNTASKSLSLKQSFLSIFYLPAAQLPGARLLLFMRLTMALAFNIFMTVWTVSLKDRFNFGPKDHAYFMGWIGLCYAVSQGLLAKVFIKRAGEDPTIVLLLCVIGLSFGRVCAMLTNSLYLVYAIMACVIVALGVMNTAMSSACSRLADQDQIGGLYGVMEAVESLAGLFGPALGGILHKLGPNVPIISVVVIYFCVFIAISVFYRSTIILYSNKKNFDGESDDKCTNPIRIHTAVSTNTFYNSNIEDVDGSKSKSN